MTIAAIDSTLARWFDALPPRVQDSLLSEALSGLNVETPPDNWRDWLTALFADYVYLGFAEHHVNVTG
jgi:hypothetical protein